MQVIVIQSDRQRYPTMEPGIKGVNNNIGTMTNDAAISTALNTEIAGSTFHVWLGRTTIPRANSRCNKARYEGFVQGYVYYHDTQVGGLGNSIYFKWWQGTNDVTVFISPTVAVAPPLAASGATPEAAKLDPLIGDAAPSDPPPPPSMPPPPLES